MTPEERQARDARIAAANPTAPTPGHLDVKIVLRKFDRKAAKGWETWLQRIEEPEVKS